MNIRFILIFLSVFSICIFQANAQPYDSEIIQETTYIALSDNKTVYTDTVVLQINNRTGSRDANIAILYQKGDKLSIGDIRIEDTHGNLIRKLSKKEIQERSAMDYSSLYTDYFVKYFEAKHNTYPYRITYSYKKEKNKFVNVVDLDLNAYSKPINDAKITVKHDSDFPIKIEQQNIVNYKTDTINNQVIHQWKYSHKPSKRQIYNDVNSSDATRLIVSPIKFYFGVDGENTNWETFGNWIYRLNLGRDKLPVEEQNKVKQIVAGISDKREQIKRIYHYLQDNTRYVNVSTKHGGLQTHPAEYVVANKYGDCKALSNYMQAMLNTIGIESFYTLIYSDDQIYDLDDNFSYNGFNHIILTIPTKNDTIFLECTSKNHPMDYVHTSIQGRKALPIKEKGSKLVNLPSLSPDQVLCGKTTRVTLAENSSANVHIASTERGEDYEILSAYKHKAAKHQIDDFILNRVLGNSFELIDYKFENENREKSSIDININCVLNNAYKQYGNNLIFKMIPFSIPRFETPQNRTADIQINYPIHYTDSIIYTISKEHFDVSQIKKLPDNIYISSPSGDKYSMSFDINDDKLIIRKQLLINAQRIALDNYEPFYNFIKEVTDSENSNFYLEIL